MQGSRCPASFGVAFKGEGFQQEDQPGQDSEKWGIETVQGSGVGIEGWNRAAT